MIKAVLFDVDGVLLDSEEIHYAVEAQALRAFDIPATVDMIKKQYSGSRLDVEFSEIAKKFNKTIVFEEVLKERDKLLKIALKDGFPKAPFVEEMLSDLSKKYLLALATMGEKHFIGEEIKRSNLQQYFKVSIFGEDVSNSKPDPEIFLKAAKLLGVKPDECIVIEDSARGIKAGKNAGMPVIARKADHNQSADLSLADYVVKDLREISKVISKIANQNNLL
jgi:HAD superfamily hydrolase (TIGR01549 family)